MSEGESLSFSEREGSDVGIPEREGERPREGPGIDVPEREGDGPGVPEREGEGVPEREDPGVPEREGLGVDEEVSGKFEFEEDITTFLYSIIKKNYVKYYSLYI